MTTKIPINEALPELVNNGLLFRINLEILHPLGMELKVKKVDEKYELDGLEKTDDLTGMFYDNDELIKSLHRVKDYCWNEENSRRRLERLKYQKGLVQTMQL